MVRQEVYKLQKQDIYKMMNSLKQSVFYNYVLDKFEAKISSKHAPIQDMLDDDIGSFEPFGLNDGNEGVVTYTEKRLIKVSNISCSNIQLIDELIEPKDLHIRYVRLELKDHKKIPLKSEAKDYNLNFNVDIDFINNANSDAFTARFEGYCNGGVHNLAGSEVFFAKTDEVKTEVDQFISKFSDNIDEILRMTGVKVLKTICKT